MNTDATCKTCLWSDPSAVADAYRDKHPNASLCRVSPPTCDDDSSPLWPVLTDATREWCGKHPERQPAILAEVGTVVQGQLTENDVRRIAREVFYVEGTEVTKRLRKATRGEAW